MKLFVWCDPYPVNYGSSMVFAVAEDEDAARLQAAQGLLYKHAEFRQKDDMSAMAEFLGKPHRVLDLPCAEWHEWAE